MSDYDPNYVHKKTYALIGQKAIIKNEANQILVLQRSEKSGAGGKWALPGGALEDKEDPFEAIEREIMEETKLKVSELMPFKLRSYTTEEYDFVVIVGYICITHTDKVVLNWEHDSYDWRSVDEALNLDLTEDARFFIEKYQYK